MTNVPLTNAVYPGGSQEADGSHGNPKELVLKKEQMSRVKMNLCSL